MDKQELVDLVRKYLNGTATREERSFVEAWYSEMDSKGSIDSLFTVSQIEALEGEIFQKVRSRITEPLLHKVPDISRPVIPMDTSSRKGAVRLLLKGAAIAASLIIIVTASWFFIQRGNRAPVFTTLYSQAGKISRITLSDGSQVWLNAGSRLRFPKELAGSGSREIYLEGEAYFDVAKDPAHPFLVHTRNLTTRVLGTRFNVRAYEDDYNIEVTLLEGKVLLSAPSESVTGKKEDTLFLLPNQKAFFAGNRLQRMDKEWARAGSQDSGTIAGKKDPSSNMLTRLSIADAEESTGWIDGNLFFRNTTFGNVIESLARKYNIHIQSDSSLLNEPVTATITGGLTPDEALLEVTRQLKRTTRKGQYFQTDQVQFRKDSSVYYVE